LEPYTLFLVYVQFPLTISKLEYFKFERSISTSCQL
jgi:hypothetical protein